MDNRARRQLRNRILAQLKHSILSDSHVTFLQGDESDQQVLGSGTLVSIGDATAILTADHVLAELRHPIRVLFPTRFDHSPGSTPGPSRTLQYSAKRTIGRGTDEARGPDLGLLIVMKCDVPHAKVFYSLTKHASRVRTEPRPNGDGGWALVGAPAEWTRIDEPHAGFASINEQRVLIAARGRSLFAEFRCSGSLAMSDWPDGRHRCPFEVPDARQTPPAVDQAPDQAANGRKSPPLQAPGRADAGLVA